VKVALDTQALDSIIQQEYSSAKLKFPTFASGHEGYAVIKEELEEAADELRFLENQLDILWMHVKENNSYQQEIATNSLIKFSRRLAQEAIQVSAMCLRFKEDVFSVSEVSQNITQEESL
jgi:hypothetical protein